MAYEKEVIVLDAEPKFQLGRLVVTAGIGDMMNNYASFRTFVQTSLEKYVQCDWGDTCAEDKMSNDEALKGDGRILAAYINKKNNTTFEAYNSIWIITECDRSVTTILFPEEY